MTEEAPSLEEAIAVVRVLIAEAGNEVTDQEMAAIEQVVSALEYRLNSERGMKDMFNGADGSSSSRDRGADQEA